MQSNSSHTTIIDTAATPKDDPKGAPGARAKLTHWTIEPLILMRMLMIT